MKGKYIGVFLLVFCIILIILANFTNKGETDGQAANEYIRIHIRANSNLAADQEVKYAVKDAVVEYLTPIIAEAKDRQEVFLQIKGGLKGVERTADGVLTDRRLGYEASAKMVSEEFPHRAYDDGTVLAGGVYDALIIELGDAKGDNWWCVVYPPLCFLDAKGTGADGVTYRSKIAELIRQVAA